MFESVCNLVDLAGSERLSKFEDEDELDWGERKNESKSINKSFFSWPKSLTWLLNRNRINSYHTEIHL